MTDKARQSTFQTGNGQKFQTDQWMVITLFVQGKIDALDLKIIDCIAQQSKGIRETARICNTSHPMVIYRLKRIARFTSSNQ